MDFLSVTELRAIDAAAGPQLYTLMLRAGVAVAAAAARLSRLRGARRVVCVAGAGNNGGDASTAARLLAAEGFSVKLLLATPVERLRGDAQRAFEAARIAGVDFEVRDSAAAWQSAAAQSGEELLNGVVVDGLLGTGCAAAPNGTVLEALRWINRTRTRALVVAIDLPSGMNGDTGECAGEAVNADWTVTLEAPKTGFLNPAAPPLLGHVEVATLTGQTPSANAAAKAQLIVPEPESGRPYAAHKGDFGRVLVLGGADRYPHAPVLSALGARHGGAGLITIAAPAASRIAAAVWVPEAMFHELPASTGGVIAGDALELSGVELNDFDVVVAGPGLSRSPDAKKLLEKVMSHYRGKLLLDADALALLPEITSARDLPELLLTPHPGEAARLAGTDAKEIQRDRMGWARRIADRYRAVVALKGAGTVVCEPGGQPQLNLTGNPGMAGGGMGDLLSGVIAAQWVRRTALAAAAFGVERHGTAGDLAALKKFRGPVAATEIAAWI